MADVEGLPKAGEFLSVIAQRFIDKHTPPLAINDALVMAWAALCSIEDDGAPFGHPDFDWTKEGALSIADEEIQLWEAAPCS